MLALELLLLDVVADGDDIYVTGEGGVEQGRGATLLLSVSPDRAA